MIKTDEFLKNGDNYETKILPAESGVAIGGELIKKGELVAFPTETVYGLGADALNEIAVRKIFAAKERPADNPLIVHISDISQVEMLARDIPEQFYALARAFMPGPLTVVLKKSDKVPSVVTAGGDTVGIRMPSNPIARQLIACSSPIAAPSANRSTHISPTTAEHVFEDMQGRIPLIIDGGSSSVGIESTVLDLTADSPTILRPGAITETMLLSVLGSVDVYGKKTETVKEPAEHLKISKSPGMKYHHYAPVVDTVLARTAQAAIEEYDLRASESRNPVLIFDTSIEPLLCGRRYISLGATKEDVARNIYASMHDAEKICDYLIIQAFDGSGLEFSIMNRLDKSAGGKYVG